MAWETSEFRGDSVYSIECTGDACTGDEVAFDRAKFSGSFRNARFAGFERVEAVIVSESYGAAKQQHTFTLKLADGSITRIKGRNLYAQGLYRKPWQNEADRLRVLAEKHNRGDIARAERRSRMEYVL